LYRVGLVGAGNMGRAMISAWIESGTVKPEEIIVSEKDPEKIAALYTANREIEDRRADIEAELVQRRAEESELADHLSDLNLRLNEATRQAAALEARIDVLQGDESGFGVTGAQLLADRTAELERFTSERGEREAEVARLDDLVSEKREKVGMLEAEIAGLEKER